MRCPRCGNENPEINRFCGMCGTTLLAAPPAQPRPAAPPPVAAPIPSVPETPRPQIVELPHREERVPQDHVPAPSFLGLNDSPPSSTRSSLAHDPHARPSGSLDYLLEDDEPRRGSGTGKFFLILIALALAAGLGYLRWKNQAFGWLSPSSSKPVAVQTSEGTSGAASAPTSTQPAVNSQPAPATVPPAPDGTSAAPPTSTSAAASPNPADSTPPANPPASTAAPTTTPSADQPKHDVPKVDQPKTDQPKTDQPSTDQPKAEQAKPDRPRAEAAAPKPEAAKPARATDAVAEARKYLYGRGAAQDCDRGMRLLKPAANEANTKAMIEMGALYSAGLCAPRDLPTAYRWFALALRKDPANQSVQGDLQKLWGEMTQPERQLAIRLTQ